MKFCSVINSKTSSKVTQIDPTLCVQNGYKFVRRTVHKPLNFYANPASYLKLTHVTSCYIESSGSSGELIPQFGTLTTIIFPCLSPVQWIFLLFSSRKVLKDTKLEYNFVILGESVNTKKKI